MEKNKSNNQQKLFQKCVQHILFVVTECDVYGPRSALKTRQQNVLCKNEEK